MFFRFFFVFIFCNVPAAFGADCSEQFSWLPNSETDIDGYRLYYGTHNGGPYPNIVNVENPTVAADGRVYGEIASLTCGSTYYAVCVAYNTQDVESNYSSQVVFTPPASDKNVAVTKIFGDASGADYAATVEDTFININDNNAFSSTTLSGYTWPENKVANSILMKINLAQIPSNAQIQRATLELYQTDAGGDATYSLTVHKILNHNPDLSQATGNVFDGSSHWTANTQCYNNIPMAQADIAPAEDTVDADQSGGYKKWDITQMVSAWSRSPSTNYGLLINSDVTASADSYRTFAANEAADASQRPKLTVVYTLTTDGLQPPTSFSLELN